MLNQKKKFAVVFEIRKKRSTIKDRNYEKKIHSGRDKKTNIENLKKYIKTLQTQYKTIPGNSKQNETNIKMG